MMLSQWKGIPMFKGLFRSFKAPLLSQLEAMRGKISFDTKRIAQLEADFLAMQDDNVGYIKIIQKLKVHNKQQDTQYSQLEDAYIRKKNELDASLQEIETLKHLSKTRKLFPDSKFYDPKNHKAVTIYVCARWNEFYMIRQQNQAQPQIMTDAEFNEVYGHYVKMPAMNLNTKNIW